jgi:maleylacetoacetate isomerase
MIKLYGYWRSTAAYRVRIALHLKALAFENISVHLVKNGGEQHSNEYRSMNPQGLVPYLVDGDFELSQSCAILEYLDDVYPQSAILPAEPQKKAKVRAFSQTIACDIHPLNNLRVLQYLSNECKLQALEKDSWYSHWIVEGFKVLEQQVAAVPSLYCFGDNISMADVCLIPQIYNANRFNIPMDDFPNLLRINKKCLENEAFHKALPENQPDAN